MIMAVYAAAFGGLVMLTVTDSVLWSGPALVILLCAHDLWCLPPDEFDD